MQVGFIFPSSDYLHDPFRGDPHTYFQLLTVLENFNDQLSLKLIDLRGIDRKFAQYHIPECEIYFYSLYTLDYEEIKGIVAALRIRFPKSKHISGGPHATIYQEDSLKIFDTIITGEGENSIVKAIEDYPNLKTVYEEQNHIDINAYPFPKRHWLPVSTVSRIGLMTTKDKKHRDLLSCTVIFSRGCPYSCSFCALPTLKKFSPGIRYRKPESIRAEIEYLQSDYGIEGISLLDEIAIPLRRDDAIPHLEAIGRTGILWRGQTRVDGLNDEIVSLARKSGCITMSLGIESVWQKSLDLINKRINIDMTRQSIKLLKKYGIECRAYLVSGLPGEPEDIVERTLNFLDETQPDLALLSLFTVRPGTEVYNYPEHFGIKQIYSDWSKTMNLQDRYDEEEIKLTFEYDNGGFSKERIISNFKELKSKITERGMSAVL